MELRRCDGVVQLSNHLNILQDKLRSPIGQMTRESNMGYKMLSLQKQRYYFSEAFCFSSTFDYGNTCMLLTLLV